MLTAERDLSMRCDYYGDLQGLCARREAQPLRHLLPQQTVDSGSAQTVAIDGALLVLWRAALRFQLKESSDTRSRRMFRLCVY